MIFLMLTDWMKLNEYLFNRLTICCISILMNGNLYNQGLPYWSKYLEDCVVGYFFVLCLSNFLL